MQTHNYAQSCSCPDKHCPLHGVPVESVVTTASLQTPNWREGKQREFFERFGADKIWVKPSKENVETVHEMWAFMLEVEKESIERAIEVVEKNIGTKVNGEGTADYKLALLNAFNGGVKISLEALKTLLH